MAGDGAAYRSSPWLQRDVQHSRVFSFTAGRSHVGGVFGALFIDRLGLPESSDCSHSGCCAVVGVVTEFVAVRPVLRSLDQHLYVLSTLALC